MRPATPVFPPTSSRREMLAAVGCAWLAAAASARRPAPASSPIELFAGGYNRESGRGVLPLTYTADTGGWRAGASVASAPDASFGAFSSRFGRHYLVQEQQGGNLLTFRVDDNGWHRLDSVPTLGDDPCHLALDRSQSVLAVANYSSGSVVLYRLDPATGLPVGPGSRRIHEGSGPNRERQDHAHAHWVGFTPDSRWLLAVDLGADAIFAHPFDMQTGALGEGRIAFRARAGSGPRHLALHPGGSYAYLVSELASTVTVLATGPGPSFRELASLSTLPSGFSGQSTAAEIALNAAGSHLYVSNRGHDSIAVFAVGHDGGLTPQGHVPSGGQGPRYFRLLEPQRRLLVANEKSGTIVPFQIEPDGRLTPHGPSATAPGVTYIGQVT